MSATNATSGLPTSEQSSLTANQSVDAPTLNRTMDTVIGTGQTSLSLSYSATLSNQNCYFGRFVSPPLNQASIASNTWTYNFAADQQLVDLNFPVNGLNKTVRTTVYVWRPSTSAKVGTIVDGISAATVDEAAAFTETAHHTTFAGGAALSLVLGDVIICEIWFQITTSSLTGGNCDFYYRGNTVNITDNAAVSNHASFLETPEDITFANLTKPHTVLVEWEES